MRPPKPRRSALLAIALLAASLGAGQALAAKGGLSVSPGILEHLAAPGPLGALEVSNTTSRPMKVRLAMRPWAQGRDGSVSPDRSRALGKVAPNRKSLWLAPGASRALGLSLTSRPRNGSLYGAVEVSGAPRYRGAKGIHVAYRLITSLRLYPPASARRYRALPGAVLEHGSTAHGALFLAVKNAGNTIDPIEGRVRISGKGRTLSGLIAPETILPGSTVDLRLARLRGALAPGRYRVGVRLTQAGHVAGGLRRGVRLR